MMILDDALPRQLIQAANAAWPAADWPGWIDYHDHGGGKRTSDLTTAIPVQCSQLLARMALMPVGDWMRAGLPPMVADMGLHGSGLHQMSAGSCLHRHLDGDTHQRLGLARVLSAVLWVHPTWEDGWGGELVLESGVRVLPRPGRLVLFDCRHAWHSVAPVNCPAEVQRRSLAMFWWSLDAGSGKRPRASFEPSKKFDVADGEE